MITRIFRIKVIEEKKIEFEKKFSTISVNTVNRAAGLLSVKILKPTKWVPDEYAMITTWNDENSLVMFAGDNWNNAVIPKEMEEYAIEYSVQHYTEW